MRGRAGLELTEGGEGRKQALSVPSPPDPGLVSASCPSRLVAAGDRLFHFGHLLSGLPLLGVRGHSRSANFVPSPEPRRDSGSFEGLLNVGNLEGDRER